MQWRRKLTTSPDQGRPLRGRRSLDESQLLHDLKGYDVPEGSEDEPMGEDWQAMSKAGYRAVGALSFNAAVLFERCTVQ